MRLSTLCLAVPSHRLASEAVPTEHRRKPEHPSPLHVRSLNSDLEAQDLNPKLAGQDLTPRALVATASILILPYYCQVHEGEEPCDLRGMIPMLEVQILAPSSDVELIFAQLPSRTDRKPTPQTKQILYGPMMCNALKLRDCMEPPNQVQQSSASLLISVEVSWWLH